MLSRLIVVVGFMHFLSLCAQDIQGRLNIVRGEAESGLERLHQCVEKELLQFLNGEGPSKDFNDFRTKLAGLTSCSRLAFCYLLFKPASSLHTMNPNSNLASSHPPQNQRKLKLMTKNYFENLVKALENGLAGVDSHAACSSKSTGCSSKARVKGKGSSRTG
ncbi:hypothetical protein F2Q69_00011613 [Brassica cretica]|uniref:Uncharacterized protein n=1 Tax=Brassica cretica TaxID=69181 RepID=A0A8S9R8D8_BRACR|nr:hypothetical protein F2Q69_00011613 [Brassica cretica]